jgi:hypothetical protein
MLAGLPVALALAAQAAAANPPATPDAKPPPTPAAQVCTSGRPDPKATEIVICAPKPDGYRINPDVLKASRQASRNRSRPTPQTKFPDTSCTVVGPAPCIGAPMINLLAAAATAAEMADRVAKGQEIGSMFKTTPTPTEYDLYVEAKRAREAEEAAKAAKAKAKAAQAAAAVLPSQPAAPPEQKPTPPPAQ